MDELGHGIYTPMDIDLLPPLYLIYAENPSDSGKVSIKCAEYECEISFWHQAKDSLDQVTKFYLNMLFTWPCNELKYYILVFTSHKEGSENN